MPRRVSSERDHYFYFLFFWPSVWLYERGRLLPQDHFLFKALLFFFFFFCFFEKREREREKEKAVMAYRRKSRRKRKFEPNIWFFFKKKVYFGLYAFSYKPCRVCELQALTKTVQKRQNYKDVCSDMAREGRFVEIYRAGSNERGKISIITDSGNL